MQTYEILAANKPTLETFGKDIVGKTCYEVLQADQDAPCEFCTNRHLVKDGKPTGPYVWKFQNTHTGRWFQCLDHAVEWPDGRLARLEIALDITDLEQAKLRLEEFGSMMGLYNDLLVHDIGNYAGTAKAFVHLITDRATPEAKKDEMGKSAIAQLNRIDTLVDRISKLTKAQAKAQESLVRCDLADVLNEAVSIVQDGCDVELRKEYDSKGYAVHLGEFASDIFVNLLSNAVKYGAGRPVTIRVSDSPISGRPAWKASIIDEGTGVSDEKKGKEFERVRPAAHDEPAQGPGPRSADSEIVDAGLWWRGGRRGTRAGRHNKGSIFYVTFPKADSGEA